MIKSLRRLTRQGWVGVKTASESINQLLGKKLPTYNPLHPNDDINKSQSSNDSIPTAMHIATVLSIHRHLFPEIVSFKKSLKKKISEFKGIIKIGRTHTQDATPIKISNEFLAFYDQISYAESVIKKSLNKLYYCRFGGVLGFDVYHGTQSAYRA